MRRAERLTPPQRERQQTRPTAGANLAHVLRRISGLSRCGSRYSRPMRRIVALALGCGSAVFALACGGVRFTVDQASPDATADAGDDVSSDGVSDAPDEASRDASNPGDARRDVSNADDASEAGEEDVADAADEPDAAEPHDARDEKGNDARAPFDAADEDVVVDAGRGCTGGFACIPAVPAGWTGPYELSAGALAAPCDPAFSGSALIGYAGLTAGSAVCGCTCDVLPAPPCPPLTIEFYATSAGCSAVGAMPCSSATLSPGACTTADALQNCDAGVAGVVMNVPASPPAPASCTALPTTALPKSTWATTARACGALLPPVAGGCPTGNVCAPAPAAPFQASLCVEQAGDVACPSPDSSTGYGVKHVYYGGVDDLRGCSTCSCTPVSGASCTVTVNQYPSTNGTCAGMPVIYGAGACQPVQQPADLQLALTPSIASCTSSTTTPTGAASPTKPMTFCCTP